MTEGEEGDIPCNSIFNFTSFALLLHCFIMDQKYLNTNTSIEVIATVLLSAKGTFSRSKVMHWRYKTGLLTDLQCVTSENQREYLQY